MSSQEEHLLHHLSGTDDRAANLRTPSTLINDANGDSSTSTKARRPWNKLLNFSRRHVSSGSDPGNHDRSTSGSYLLERAQHDASPATSTAPVDDRPVSLLRRRLSWVSATILFFLGLRFLRDPCPLAPRITAGIFKTSRRVLHPQTLRHF